MGEPTIINLDHPPCCCLCGDEIEEGYMIEDEDGCAYCENCWQP